MTTPISGTVCYLWLGLAMFNPHTKFDVSTITCKEDMKGDATPNVKILVLSHPLGG